MSIITVSSMLLAVGAVAYADTTLKKISAYQNAAISIEVDNQKVNLSSSEGTMYPIIYEGHSYVSAKAVSEALGATVKWDNSRQAVVITSANGGTSTSVVPDKDNTVAQATAKPATVSTPPATESTPQATPKPAASSSATTSSNSGASFADAVKLGTSLLIRTLITIIALKVIQHLFNILSLSIRLRRLLSDNYMLLGLRNMSLIPM